MSSPFIIIDEITSKINEMNTSLTTKIDNLIGATGNTGGSATAGTVMAKLNAIIGNTATNNTASTSGNLSQKISSAISNTAATTKENSSGTLSAKLTYLINRRNRGVKAGSTNFMTLSSNISASTTTTRDSQTSYSSYTSEYICSYTGRYRIYCTGNVTVNKLGYNSSYTNSRGTDRNYLKFEVWVNGTTYTSDVVATQGNAVGTSASSTKTLDITLVSGQVIKARLVAITEAYNVPCWGVAAGNQITVKATDLSIRGSIVELTGSPIM